MVTKAILIDAICSAGLANNAVCIHASLKSFGHLEGGADTVVQAFLEANSTILVPTFTFTSVPPPLESRPLRNGSNYSNFSNASPTIGRRYSASENDLDIHEMGRIPEAVLLHSDRVRGDHPLNSFAAVGPLASRLISGQHPLDVYSPLRELAELDGYIVLMGVGLNKLTLIHLAEQMSGRNPFRRWGTYLDQRCVEAQVGGCSEGFNLFESVLKDITNDLVVGSSHWRILPAAKALELSSKAILSNPKITHCSNPECERCNDAILGGPQFDQSDHGHAKAPLGKL